MPSSNQTNERNRNVSRILFLAVERIRCPSNRLSHTNANPLGWAFMHTLCLYEWLMLLFAECFFFLVAFFWLISFTAHHQCLTRCSLLLTSPPQITLCWSPSDFKINWLQLINCLSFSQSQSQSQGWPALEKGETLNYCKLSIKQIFVIVFFIFLFSFPFSVHHIWLD